MYNLVQEMGCVDWLSNLPPVANRYEIHLSVPLFVSLYVRIMSVPDREECNKQLVGIYEVLTSIMVPAGCQYLAMELYFEQDTRANNKVAHGNFCSFCTGRVNKHAGKFRKHALTHLILGKLSNRSAPTFEAVLKFSRRRKKIGLRQGFGPEEVGVSVS